MADRVVREPLTTVKANYKTRNGQILCEVQGETVKDLFRGISQAQEVFESANACGACQSNAIRFIHRVVDDNEYFELGCADCFARLQFGQHKKGGTLFPKRKDEANNWLPNGGWQKYERAVQTQTTQTTDRHAGDTDKW